MTRFALPLIALLASPALAQEPPATDQYEPPLAEPLPEGSTEESVDLIERGVTMLFMQLFSEIAPEMDVISRDLADGLAIMGPAMTDLSVLVDDISNYQTPERLENGDIVIRRKPGAPPPPEIGENLKQFGQGGETTPDDAPPVDPDQPEIEL